MIFMNDYDIHQAKQRCAGQPVTMRAVAFLERLVEETNEHSDGWAHWPLPCRAAAQLQELIQERVRRRSNDITETELERALRPVKSFYTRRGYAAGMKFPQVA